MKKIYTKLNMMLLCIAFFLMMSSCGMKESYKEFHVEKVAEYEKTEYFTAEELDFARINNVVIIPEIKEILHGEYMIYIAAYSLNGMEQVTIKKVSLEVDENIIFCQDTEQNIIFQQEADEIYGWINAGVFTETNIDLSTEKKMYLTVQAQVEDDSQEIKKEIVYKIDLIQYRRHTMPT